MKTVKKLFALLLSLCLMFSFALTANAEEITIETPDVSVKVTDMKQGTMVADGFGNLTGTIATLAVTIQKVPGANRFFVAPLRRIAPGNNFSSFEKTGEGTMPTTIANPGEKPKFETINGEVEVGPNGEKITETEKDITIEKKVCMLDSASYSAADNIMKSACYKENENIVVEAQAYYMNGDDPSTYKGSEYVYVEFPFNNSSNGKTFTPDGGVETNKSLKDSKVTVKPNTFTYNGKEKKPNVEVTVDGKALKMGEDFTVSYKNNKNAGTAYVTVTGKGVFVDGKTVSFKINKAKNTASFKGKTIKIKKANLKKKNVKFSIKKAVTFKNVQGKVIFKKTDGNKKIAVSKDGKITVKKGLKKGTYKVKVKASIAGNKNYKKSNAVITFKVKVV